MRTASLFLLLTLVAAAPAFASRAEVDSLVARAHTLAGESRHAEAAAAFEAALAEAPNRVDDLSGPLAFQYAWAGQLDDAYHEFHRAVALHPEDHDLRLGQLLVLNWMGMHLAAWDGYDALYRTDVTDPRPVVGLAAAQNWAGRRDLSLKTLDAAQALDPGNKDAANLVDAIRDALRPSGGMYHDYSEDSDGYRVNGLWVEGVFSTGPQWTLVPFVNEQWIREAGFPSIDDTWLGAKVVGRPATRVGIRGRLSLLTDRPGGATFSPWTGNAAVEYTLTDRWHLNAYAERFAAITYLEYPQRITGHVLGAGAVWRPDWLTEVSAALDHAGYSDDNARWNLAASGMREIYPPFRVHVGGNFRYLNFDRWLDNGLWTPDWFWALAAAGNAEMGPRDKWTVGAGLELGPSREAGGDLVLYDGYWVGATWTTGRWSVEGKLGHSEGNTVGPGYDRSYTHLGVRYRF